MSRFWEIRARRDKFPLTPSARWILHVTLAIAASCVSLDLCHARAFDISSLKALLRKNPATDKPVDSIRELVPLLPRELRANFTFVYESRSPFRDGISPDFPRVILFTPDARLILTFTGRPGSAGDGILETMAFSDERKAFETTVVVMPEAERRGVKLTSQLLDCQRCHGMDPRPIFDSYPLWPGFYGSIQDTFPRDSSVGRRELADYRRFLKNAAKTGVYGALAFSPENPFFPYLDPDRFRSEDVVGSLENFPSLPNTRLGMALTQLNRQRIARKLLGSSSFVADETRLLKGLLECPGFELVTDEDVREISAVVHVENQNRLARLRPDFGDPAEYIENMAELDFSRALAQLDAVAKRARISRSDWSMALEPNSLSFYDGILSGLDQGRNFYLKEDLIFELLAHLRKSDPAYRKYFSLNLPYAGLGYPFGRRISLATARRLCLAAAKSSVPTASSGF